MEPRSPYMSTANFETKSPYTSTTKLEARKLDLSTSPPVLEPRGPCILTPKIMIKSSEQTLDPNPIGIKQVTEISSYLEIQKESNNVKDANEVRGESSDSTSNDACSVVTNIFGVLSILVVDGCVLLSDMYSLKFLLCFT